MIHVVLVEPEIPGNTGNIARTCVGTQSHLHLVGKLGFSLNDKYLKRAGLDYWQDLKLTIHKDWETFLQAEPHPQSFFFFEKDAEKNFWDAPFPENCYLIFGSETKGFSKTLTEAYKNQFYRIPMMGPVRSLNLSNAAAIAIYETLRRHTQRGYSPRP